MPASPDDAVAAAPLPPAAPARGRGEGLRPRRYSSLNELLQLAAFALWRRGRPLGEIGADAAHELWGEWLRHRQRLESAYTSAWLPAWLENGFFCAVPIAEGD